MRGGIAGEGDRGGVPGTDVDGRALVSVNDAAPGFLNGKLVAGTGITLTEGSDGGDETLTIACTITGTVTGTGAANRIAYWSSASALTSSANLTFDGSSLLVGAGVRVGIGGATDNALVVNTTATNPALAINSGSGFPVLTIRIDTVDKAYFGVARGANDLITGTAVGDAGIRVVNKKLWFSTDNGASADVVLDTTGYLGVGVTAPESYLHTKSLGLAYHALSADTTLSDEHHYVVVDTSGGAKTITLPAASGAGGRLYGIKRSGANNVTISPTGVDTIDGAASRILAADNDAAFYISNNAGDWVLYGTG